MRPAAKTTASARLEMPSKAKMEIEPVSEIKFSSDLSRLTIEAFIARVDEAIAREDGERQHCYDASSGDYAKLPEAIVACACRSRR